MSERCPPACGRLGTMRLSEVAQRHREADERLAAREAAAGGLGFPSFAAFIQQRWFEDEHTVTAIAEEAGLSVLAIREGIIEAATGVRIVSSAPERFIPLKRRLADVDSRTGR